MIDIHKQIIYWSTGAAEDNVGLSPERRDFLGTMNLYNIAGRYPDEAFPKPSMERAKGYYEQAGRLVEWLRQML